MKRIFIGAVKFYQHFISPLLPKSCRYYPSCSEYAIWQFQKNSFFLAFVATIWRIIRCNQLFKGGVDYPIIKIDHFDVLLFPFNPKNSFKQPEFWFVPQGKNKYYLIKSLGESSVK